MINHVKRITAVLLFSLFALLLVPGMAGAQAASTETITMQVNFTTPNGHSIIGTVVAHRIVGNPTHTQLTFTGMIDGSPATATADATEVWSGGSLVGRIKGLAALASAAAAGSSDLQAVLTIDKITSWHAAVPQPDPPTLNIVQTAPGVVSLNGLPIAMNGVLHAPGYGSINYTFTNPGQGPTPINVLPNTGAGPLLADPMQLAGMLVLAGLLLMGAGLVLGRQARRAVPVRARVD